MSTLTHIKRKVHCYIFIYYMYTWNHENNVPSWLSPQGLHGTVHYVPKCISCHKAIAVITGRTHCSHDFIYITPILLLCHLSTVCRGSLMTIYTLYIYITKKQKYRSSHCEIILDNFFFFWLFLGCFNSVFILL